MDFQDPRTAAKRHEYDNAAATNSDVASSAVALALPALNAKCACPHFFGTHICIRR
jgi:hypothetical protein